MASSRRIKRTNPVVKESASVRPAVSRLPKKWLVGFTTFMLVLLLIWKFAPANSTLLPTGKSSASVTTASLNSEPTISSLLTPSPIVTPANTPMPEAVRNVLPTSIPAEENEEGAKFCHVVDKKIENGKVTLLLKDEETGELSTMTQPLGTNIIGREGKGGESVLVSTATATKQLGAPQDTVATQGIETIRPGMKVPTRNPITGETEFKTVTRTFKHTAYEIVKVEFTDGKTDKVVDSLRGTPEHPFFTPSGRVAMGNLKPEMKVITRRGQPLIVKSVTRESHPEGIPVYNFEVEGDHSYFVGKAEGGSWVHNECPPIVSAQEMVTLDLTTPAWRNSRLSGNLVYVLRDTETGELLKVGNTGLAYTRFGPYAAAGRRTGRELAVDVFDISGKPNTAVESEIRKYFIEQGHELPWDHSRELNRPGPGLPR